MPVPSAISDLSQTAGSNYPAGSESPGTLDDYHRALASFVAGLRDGKGLTNPVSLASATTTDIGGQNSLFVEISGTTTITGFGTSYNGPRFLRFTGALLLTHSASLNLPGGVSITTVPGDTAIAVPSSGLTGWNVVNYQRTQAGPAVSAYLAASGGSISTATFTKVLFDTEQWDTNACFAASRFTPTVPGYYQINAALQVNTASPGFLTIYKNGSEFKRGAWNAVAASQQDFDVSGLVLCNGTTDYIEVYGYQESGGSRVPQGGAAVTWFDAHFVRGL